MASTGARFVIIQQWYAARPEKAQGHCSFLYNQLNHLEDKANTTVNVNDTKPREREAGKNASKIFSCLASSAKQADVSETFH